MGWWIPHPWKHKWSGWKVLWATWSSLQGDWAGWHLNGPILTNYSLIPSWCHKQLPYKVSKKKKGKWKTGIEIHFTRYYRETPKISVECICSWKVVGLAVLLSSDEQDQVLPSFHHRQNNIRAMSTIRNSQRSALFPHVSTIALLSLKDRI